MNEYDKRRKAKAIGEGVDMTGGGYRLDKPPGPAVERDSLERDVEIRADDSFIRCPQCEYVMTNILANRRRKIIDKLAERIKSIEQQIPSKAEHVTEPGMCLRFREIFRLCREGESCPKKEV